MKNLPIQKPIQIEDPDKFIHAVKHNLRWTIMFTRIYNMPEDVQAKIISLRNQADEHGILPAKYPEYITSEKWKKKREGFLSFYGERCSVCHSKENLHVHHRDYSEFGQETTKSCTVLCDACHAYVHPDGEMAKDWFEKEYPNIIGSLHVKLINEFAVASHRRNEEQGEA